MSSFQPDEFVELERTFHDLRVDVEAGDDGELRATLFRGEAVAWSQLLAEYRVVLLAEAGAGKTKEIRATAKRLRHEGRSAFFLRIEHIAGHLEDAFEVGNAVELEAWLASGEEGWLLLDSVDEARLGSPKDFELAMRVLSRRIKVAMQRAHIVITGRTTAWRPKTDLQLCRSLFPYNPPEPPAGDEDQDSGKKRKKGDGNAATKPFRIVALDDLGHKQIERFLLAKGVENATAFLDAVERADAWTFTTRPQDLEELAGFWLNEHRIGSRLEIMRASIDRRLAERDQDRAEARPLSAERARAGARLVAAATTLAKQPLVSIPDATEDGRALSIRKILVGWTEAECAALVSRPIFDEAIYGAVRFHHRSVREYLIAEWLQSLLVRQGSRRRIEELFFREQYSIPVVVPAMRPILAWLAILDEGILRRVLHLAPEITFEGGDPSQLPAATRRTVLRQVCEQLAQPAHGRSALDYAAVQRFAGADIAGDIRSLLVEYADDDNIVWFLLRLVWHGELKEVAPEAKRFALGAREKYARIAALKAVRTIGTARDIAEVLDAILVEPDALLRDWLDEIVQGLPRDEVAVEWLAKALEKVEPKERFSVDSLSETLPGYIDGLPPDLLAKLGRSIGELLKRAPLIERRYCRISEQYQWLAQFGARTIARLIEVRHPQALEEDILAMLRNIRIAREYHDLDMREARAELPQLVQSWPDLNHALFWFCVAEARAGRPETDGPLVDYRHVLIFGADWGFVPADFDLIHEDVTSRSIPDDRRIAQTLAFAIYVRSGRPRAWRERMKRTAAGHPDLEDDLKKLLHPPGGGRATWREQERKRKRRHARREARGLREAEKSKDYLQTHLDAARGLVKGVGLTNAQHYLLHKMKNGEEAQGHWTDGNWESLIPEFGEEVARAFRDGMVAFWRRSRPFLLSEGGTTGSTPFGLVFGLAGLAIEAREIPNWAVGLGPADAELAVRYALQELNGFPSWLPDVYAQHPDVVMDIVIKEIAHELATDTGERESHYLLHDASWSGQWMWDRLGPALLPELAHKPRNAGNLRYILNILQGSPISDMELATAAAAACAGSTDTVLAAIWFAAWVGVNPASALTEFDSYLVGLPNDAARTKSVMVLSTHLLGNRRTGAVSRQAFRTVHYLKRIFVLLHTHVRRRDDIERAGKGVYSPGLRDDAQDARDSIFAFLRDMPGKEAFLALMELSLLHPDDAARPWMAFHAKAKAEQDSDAAPWKLMQFVEFNAELERTPSNHRELWELALSRMLDLKDDLERGDTSIASILLRVDAEEELRNFVGGWCRDRASGRYSVPQEEEFADARRPDLRFLGMGFDAPVPVELKIADKWTGPHLFERLETQLCGDYLRDQRSELGLFVLLYRGTRDYWELPDGTRAEDLSTLVDALQRRWAVISDRYPGIEDVRVVGIDLEERGRRLSEQPGDTKP
jgi:hypothetical protein